MFSCCGDYLVGRKIKKAHCIDGAIIEELFSPDDFQYNEKPTRNQCGCTESTDIGTYDTCPHGCVYCYANANKSRAYKAFRSHAKNSAFLGYSKSDSDRWLMEIAT
jgi:histone acetyltransferase (RNA polymerase elongator complex component)